MKYVKVFILVFVVWLLFGVLSKVGFMCLYHDIAGGLSLNDAIRVIGHGVRLDLAIAGYLTLLPALMLLVGVWVSGKVLLVSWRICFACLSFMVSLAYAVNVALYEYWGFPLDNTPLLYLKTSPADAFASLTLWQILLNIVELAVLFGLMYWTFEFVVEPRKVFVGNGRMLRNSIEKISETLVLLLLTAILIVPIRGGFGTGTNHTGSVYFSSNMRLNHAAVNPVFSFVESVTHSQDIGSQFRFMEESKADSLFRGMVYTELRAGENTDSANIRCSGKPNVILIMLEGFSKYIMTEGGHVEGVTPRLDAFTKEGLYFDRFYANSVRTDRGIVSILSGLPAQPNMSIMDMPKKSTALPSVARSLLKNGYDTYFYYGGDTNYSNMLSYIVGTGYTTVVSDKDFPAKLQTSKWGVHDGYVFERILKDIDEMNSDKPFFITLMTLSSHEPFDVPYESPFENKALNAFAYTDHELGKFVDSLKSKSMWQNTLLVMVPDHLGAYPKDVDNYQLWRYEIPLIMFGGAVDESKKVHTIGSQNDIAATVLGLLGVEHQDFVYSKDLLDNKAPHFAFFSFPDASFGMITEDNQVLYDDIANRVIWDIGSSQGTNIVKAKAYIQKLYDDIDGM